MTSKACQENWLVWLNAELAADRAQKDLVENCASELPAVLRSGLRNREEKDCVLRLVRNLGPEIREELLEEFVQLACQSSYVPSILQAREILAALPRNRTVARFEHAIEPILASGDEWIYRRALEAAALLDVGLTLRIAERASQNQDPEIKNAGDEFLENPRPR